MRVVGLFLWAWMAVACGPQIRTLTWTDGTFSMQVEPLEAGPGVFVDTVEDANPNDLSAAYLDWSQDGANAWHSSRLLLGSEDLTSTLGDCEAPTRLGLIIDDHSELTGTISLVHPTEDRIEAVLDIDAIVMGPGGTLAAEVTLPGCHDGTIVHRIHAEWAFSEVQEYEYRAPAGHVDFGIGPV